MSKIEVIESTIQGIDGVGNYYGGLLAAKTECGGYAWAIENYDGESWQLIPESLYIELVKFNSTPIQIGDKDPLIVTEPDGSQWVALEDYLKIAGGE